ncbi:MAG TPA: hypothetical protein VFS42_01595 [Burkholderiaceae bacterium]|nr:hypothetical protein [Burkholderiaceae bacterium]
MRFETISRMLCAGALVVLAACSSTRITNAWQDPQWKAEPYRKLLVITVSKEAGIRRTYETVFTDRLREAGVSATPSYTLIAEDGPVSEERIRQEVGKIGADAILMTRLVRTERRTSVSPGYVMGVPAVGYWGGWYGFYSAAWAVPPSYNQYDVVTLETNIWDAKTNKLVWSGTTETVDPASVNQVANELSALLVKEMRERRVIPIAAAR